MLSFTRYYTLCSPVWLTGTYRVKAHWPKYSASPAFFELSDAHGNGFTHFSEAWTGQPLEMVDLNISSPAAIPEGETTIALRIELPDDAVSAAGTVEFLLEDVPVRNRRFQSGFPADCFETAEPPPISVASYDFRGRFEQIFSAKMIAALYDDFPEAIRLAKELAGDTADILGVAATDMPGSGVLRIVQAERVLIWVIGTTTSSQLVAQALQFIDGPVTFGSYSTIPLWELGAIFTHNYIGGAAIPNTYRATICGHSMGGAIATVLAAKYRVGNPEREIEVLTFGMPRPGDERLRDLMDSCRVWQVRNEFDPIPFTAPHRIELGNLTLLVPSLWLDNFEKFVDVRSKWSLYANGEYVEGGFLWPALVQLSQIINAWLVGAPQPQFPSHRIAVYRERLEINFLP